MTSLLELAQEFFNRENNKNINQSQSGDYSKLKPDFLPETNIHKPASTPEVSYKDDGTEELKMPAIQIAGNPSVPKYIPEMNAVGTYPATSVPSAYNMEDTFKGTPVSTNTPFANMSSGPMSYANPADDPKDPFFYSKKNVIDPTKVPDNLAASRAVSPASLQTRPRRETITRSEDPTVRKAEEGALSKLLNPESDSQIDEQKLLNDYLLALKNSKDNEAKLTTMNVSALDNSRLAMLGEGLSESASKMGNLMGKPTGSTMTGFGKEAGAIEQNNVDQQRKIYEGANPEVQLARTAQIATMLEGIRSSRAKSALEAGKIAIPKPGANDKEKALNVAQTKNRDFAARMAAAEKVMEDLEAKGYKPNTYRAMASKSVKLPIFGKVTSSADAIAYDQARDEWINALARKDSGAAIKDSEYDKYDSIYMPQGSDPDSMIAQRRKSRKKIQQNTANSTDANFGSPAPLITGGGSVTPTQAAPRSQAGQGGATVGGIPPRHQGKINFKDTITGKMYSADTEEEFNQMNNQGNASQGGQPRFVRIK